MLVATFSGNVPDFDLLAATEEGATAPVQVKALCKGHWQFTIEKFVEVRMKGKKTNPGKENRSQDTESPLRVCSGPEIGV